MAEQGQNMPDLSGILGGLLSNPTVLSSALSMLGNLTKAQNNEEQKEPTSNSTPAVSQINPPILQKESDSFENSTLTSIMPSPLSHGARPGREKALLIALKPFLSKSKCDTIDMFIKLVDILALIGRIK